MAEMRVRHSTPLDAAGYRPICRTPPTGAVTAKRTLQSHESRAAPTGGALSAQPVQVSLLAGLHSRRHIGAAADSTASAQQWQVPSQSSPDASLLLPSVAWGGDSRGTSIPSPVGRGGGTGRPAPHWSALLGSERLLQQKSGSTLRTVPERMWGGFSMGPDSSGGAERGSDQQVSTMCAAGAVAAEAEPHTTDTTGPPDDAYMWLQFEEQVRLPFPEFALAQCH